MKHIQSLTQAPAKAQTSRLEIKIDFIIGFAECAVILIIDLFGSGGSTGCNDDTTA